MNAGRNRVEKGPAPLCRGVSLIGQEYCFFLVIGQFRMIDPSTPICLLWSTRFGWLARTPPAIGRRAFTAQRHCVVNLFNALSTLFVFLFVSSGRVRARAYIIGMALKIKVSAGSPTRRHRIPHTAGLADSCLHPLPCCSASLAYYPPPPPFPYDLKGRRLPPVIHKKYRVRFDMRHPMV